jgi:uncharacterized phage protein (TIGR01671 family)
MREIKFRVWKKDTGNWCSRPNMYINGWGELNYVLGGEIEDYCSKDQYDVQLHTGLKDKNGTEIYEGDIVRYSSSSHEGEVKFWMGRFLISSEKDNAHYKLQMTSDLEVIGNIYENPELVTNS